MQRFTFPVKTEKEIEESKLIQEGNYPSTVESCEFKETKTHEPMLSLKLKLKMPDGKERPMFCNIVLNENWAFLHRHFWESAGYVDKYEKGELPVSEYLGRTVVSKIKNSIDKSTGKMRSNIQDFVVEDGEVFLDDDIPLQF